MRFFFALFYSCSLISVSVAQSDSLRWSDNISFIVKKAGDNTVANKLFLNYSIQQYDDSSLVVSAYANESKSWFSEDIMDSLQQKLFYFQLSSAELWSRKQNLWLDENYTLPKDYRLAAVSDSWEKFVVSLDDQVHDLEFGENTDLLDSLLVVMLLEMAEYPATALVSTFSPWGYGMDFFVSQGSFSKNNFSNVWGMGVALQLFYKNAGLNLQGDIMQGSVVDEFYASRHWQEGLGVQHGHFSAVIEYRVFNSDRINISPFAGSGYFESVPQDSTIQSSMSYRKIDRIYSISPVVGVNFDFKLNGQVNLDQMTYWLIRFGVSYIPLNYDQGIEFGYWGIKLGAGGYSRFMKN